MEKIDEMIEFVAKKDGVGTESVEWFSWPHAFPSTSGPKGGAGGCMITTFQVFAFNTGVNRYKFCAGVWRRWSGEFMDRW